MKPTSILEKVLSAIVVILVIYGSTVTLEKQKFENKYNTELEKQVTIVNDSIEALNNKLKALTQNAQNWTNNAKEESNAINEKLHQDEEAIDNYIVTDADLSAFLAKHENN